MILVFMHFRKPRNQPTVDIFFRFCRVDIDSWLVVRDHFARTLQVHLADVSAEVRAEREGSTAQPTQVIPVLSHLYRTHRLQNINQNIYVWVNKLKQCPWNFSLYHSQSVISTWSHRLLNQLPETCNAYYRPHPKDGGR